MSNHAQLTARDIHGPFVQLLTNLQGDNGREWLDALNRFLRKEPCWVAGGKTAPTKSAESPLTKRAPVQFDTLDESLDLQAFYQMRAGLYVWNDFIQFVLAPARADTTAVKLEKLWYRDLKSSERDVLIEAHLGKNHLFGDREVSLLIASLIAKQKNGEVGVLLYSGKANLFYTKSRVVCVNWYSDGRQWGVHSYARDGIIWSAGCRVFFRN